MAPSPSGRMHLGNVFAFLIAWADALQNSGNLILRVDDLDDRCKKPEVLEALIADLKWLGLDWDGDAIYQSERIDVYKDAWRELEKVAEVYPCFCSRADLHSASAPHASDGTPIYDGKCRALTTEQIAELKEQKPPATRIAVPDSEITAHDYFYGDVTANLKTECGDMIMKRSDGVFSYQFTNAVDDALLGVNRIVRGNDLLSSAPREVWLISELAKVISDINTEDIEFVHLPMLVNVNGQRLAKRDHSLDLGEIQKTGATPEHVIGKISHLIGLTEKFELISAQEFQAEFSLEQLRSKTQFEVPANLFAA
ncbi:MAG: glutamate--tRNA ligase family protein [Phoenicibacter congonensis]|uniref:Glutamate--tRNA ligase family protein n=1 Tax=Phoenicibacter congonensis TaxID=1944646 RepID=A0AA43RH62_9ACTN|nr:glutamate--tRNA ligase family protein [Phoenicibacter congonensis]